MYYLKSKVIIGYVGNNLKQDAQMVPDVIVYREGWNNISPQIFVNYMKRNKYRRVSFPVIDSDYNNIPELNLGPLFRHQFRTLKTNDDRMKINIFLKR
jgi:hypothetical protein